MTPEQKAHFYGIHGRLVVAEIARESEQPCMWDPEKVKTELDAELSHYVRVPEPTPASERRCGGCVHHDVCRYHGTARLCPHYRDESIPSGIAAVIRAAHAERATEIEWLSGLPEDRCPELRTTRMARIAAVDALSKAELAMAGVKEEHGKGT